MFAQRFELHHAWWWEIPAQATVELSFPTAFQIEWKH